MLPAPAREMPTDISAAVTCPQVETARVRAVISPVHTAIASLFEVVGGWRRGADDRWVAAMLRRAGGIDLEPLSLFAAEERIVPDTLMPVPSRSGLSWDDALLEVRAIPARAIHDELVDVLDGRVPSPELQAWLDDPAAMQDRFLTALDAWWRAVLAPQWPRMLALLETELLRVGRMLALEGHGPTLAALHPRIRWDGGRLELPVSPTCESDRDLDDRPFVLLPMACGPDGLLCGKDHPDFVTLAYAAPGTGALFSPEPDGSADPLAEALGAGRSAVLRALDGPRSMRALGLEVGLSASTVHSHLQGLTRSELVHRGRVGRNVVYARTQRGERLVSLF